MKCQECGSETRVIDSRHRLSKAGVPYTRRVRACIKKRCGLRVTTYERLASDLSSNSSDTIIALLKKMQATVEAALLEVQRGEQVNLGIEQPKKRGLSKSHRRDLQVGHKRTEMLNRRGYK